MTQTLTAPDYDTVLATLRECVEERGRDYVYKNVEADNNPLTYSGPSCAYWHPSEEKPGCIIGLMFYKLGFVDDIKHLDGFGNDIQAGGAVSAWQRIYGKNATEKIQRLIDETQSNQDQRLPWGEALDMAIREVDGREWYDNGRLIGLKQTDDYDG